MLKATTIILSLLLAETYLFGQKMNARTKALDIYTYQLDTTKNSTDTTSFLFDSIKVKAQVQSNRIVSMCFFERSKSVLTINFYKKSNN
jgi:hypothetical protein